MINDQKIVGKPNRKRNIEIIKTAKVNLLLSFNLIFNKKFTYITATI
jgi:hypothetical protein